MEKKAINYEAINRSVSNQLITDGWLDEYINIRTRNGKRQPVGHPTKLHNLPIDTYSKIWLHDQDGINNYVGFDANNNLNLISMATGAGTVIHNYADSIQIQFLKRFMIVVHSDGMHVYLWNNEDNKYDIILMPERPLLSFTTEETKLISSNETTGANAVLGKYYKSLNEQSQDNFHTGGIMFRAAFRMFDGSYVLHSLPEYLQLGLTMIMTEKSVDGEGEDNDPNSIKYMVSKAQVGLNKLHYTLINKNIFTAVCIFACKNEELYDISEDTITDYIIEDKVKSQGEEGKTIDVDFNDIFDGSISEDFKNMVDSPSWYLVHEIDIEDVEAMPDGPNYETIDLKGFYQDYATREVLTVDQFSHHQFNGSFSYNFNSRLIIGDASTIFGSYQYYPLNPAMLVADGMIFPAGYQYFVNRNCKLVVSINTSSGYITKVIDVGWRPFALYNNKEWMVIARGVLGYPDARAKKITLLVEQGTNWYKVQEFKLKSSSDNNYAYYHSGDFSSDPNTINNSYASNFNYLLVGTDYPASSIININTYTDGEFNDDNIIKISELTNPFIYPTENTYEVGTGKALNVATNTIPLSSGQFGEHPLIVFTSKGRFAMYQGQGDVLFSNVKPLDGDVPELAELIISVGSGVVYTTIRGVYIASGTNVQELSSPLLGSPNLELQAVDNYTFRLNHIQLVQLRDSLSTVDAKTYLNDSILGYDQKNNEFWISNPNYNYSYVYSFDSNHWGKRSTSYKLFINAYPRLLGVNMNANKQGVFNISQEHFDQDVHVLCTTRPCKIDTEANFILIHRAIQRCELNTPAGVYSGFYVFGSNDLHTWQLFQGCDKKSGFITDLFCTRSHLKAKYFIFVFASVMSEGDTINHIDIQYYNKLTNKIR